jgi:hypothetical protein
MQKTIPPFTFKLFRFFSLFFLLFTGQSFANDCTLPLFALPWHFSNAARTVRTAVADFNNDGNLDIAATAHDASFVGVFIGDGTGNFVRQTVLSAGNFSVPVSAGDFNNDGKQDLAVGSRDGTVWIYLGNGNGGFSSPSRYGDGPGEAYEMAVADFNHDGFLDLAIGHQFAGLAIMIGNGNGGFSFAGNYIYNLGPVKVVSADFNNDGNIDLMTENAQGANRSVLLGVGNGTFIVNNLPIPPTGTHLSNSGFAVGDFNGDGHADFVTSGGDTSLVIFFGDGQANFPNSLAFVSSANKDPHAADFDGDGHLDIVATGHPNPMAAVLLGNGIGGFGPPIDFSVGGGPQGSSVADFNNDGRPDVVTPNYFGSDITVSINNGMGMQDTSSPIISSAPDILSYATAPGGANVVYQIIAFDNSGTTPTFDCTIPSNSFFPVGTTGVMCSAVDACGNHSSNFSFNVTVGCAPLDLSPLGSIEVNATSSSGAVIDYANISGVASVTFSIPSGSTFPIGTTQVHYEVTELCGHTVPGSFDVHVVDSGPELTIPVGISTFATSASGKIVSYSATAVDAVSATLAVTCAPPSGTLFPMGQTTVNCQATDGAGNTASGSFVVAVMDCIGCISPTFEPARSYGIENGTFRTAAGDFNNDGKMDVVGTAPGGVAIFYGDGTGNFAAPIYLPAGGFDVPAASGDFNNDGKTDLAVGSSDGVVYIYMNNGSGLDQPTFYADHGGEAYEIAVADFNSDGKTDLAIGHQFAGLAILFGNGSGGFAEPVDYLEGNGPVQVSKGDFNGDGKTDLITANAGTGDTSLLINNGSGGFNISSASIPATDFAVADFNGDGKTDIVAGTGDSSVGLYVGDGHGAFTAAGSFDTGGSGLNGIKAADFNGDAKFDVVVSNGWSDTVSILIGDGHGVFSPPLSFATASGPIGITATDLNADGRPDIAVAAYFAGQVSVLINNTYQTPLGENSTVVVNNTIFTFNNVTRGGTTSIAQIDPATVGQVPGGFAVSNSVAYEIATTATFTGSVTLAFKIPGPISQADFNNLAILHNENGTLVDITATTPTRDYSNLTIYARTTSFSPFYLARRGPHIRSLFDQTKAYKSGSTIPIKLQLLNASNGNLSSSANALVARDLRRLSSNTTAPVVDSGNANPDYAFRYDPTLGGTGGGYIFNLSAKGLASGQYVLSFYAGSDRSFFYTVKFEVK